MATKKPDELGEPPPDPRYRVLSSGISTATGAVYRGRVVHAADLGDADRVAKLLARRAIEVVTDDD